MSCQIYMIKQHKMLSKLIPFLILKVLNSISLCHSIHCVLTVALYLSFLFRKLTFCSTMCPCNSSDNIHGEVRILCNLANCGFSLRDIEL